MFNSPLLKKAEEKACVKKDESPDDDSTPSPPAKKLCTVYAKQLAKLPSGDQGLVKDLLQFIELFKSDDVSGHPAHTVMDMLAGKIEDSNKLHAQQMETWFRDYANWRENPSIFKDVVELDRTSDGETIKLPLISLKFTLPADGLPPKEDWLNTLESMIFGGVNLGREPLDGSLSMPETGSCRLEPGSVDIIKGWARSTCVATILAAASEVDVTTEGADLLKPIVGVLDKCWLIPVHVTLNASEVEMSYRNLTLSCQGSERQAPNNLQLALRFSRIIQIKQSSGEHPKEWGLEEGLRAVVSEYHTSPGLISKHRIDDDKFRSLMNIIGGTCPEARSVIQGHLDRHKWRESAWSSDQFRSTRWVLGTSPKLSSCPLKKALTVTKESQIMHLKLVEKSFVDAGRKLRPSARPKMRLSQEQFDRHCDYACIMSAAVLEARQLASWNAEKEAEVMKLFFQKDYFKEIEATISSKLETWELKHLSLWSDYIEPRISTITVPDTEEIAAMEDEAQAARFREIKAKISQDEAAMTQFNARVAENKRRHVVTVMHERSQIQVGKELAENHMQKWHKVLHVTDLKALPSLDPTYRLTTSVSKVPADDIQTIIWVDCTKLGVVTQPEINALGDFLEKHLSKNPVRSVAVVMPPLLFGSSAGGSLRLDWRKIEDKLVACNIELRNFALNLDVGEIHKNREFPACYFCWLGVLDSTLPNKGTAHRALRGGHASDAPTTINQFCASDLWTRQSLLRFPQALQEKDFVVPGEGFISHDGRRNLTDLQETSQWLGGVSVAKGILEGLIGSDLKKVKPTVIINPTCYDGAVELAAIQMGMTSVSCTPNPIYFKCATEIVKDHLLKAWKDSKVPMDKALPRYRQEVPSEEIPIAAQTPDLCLCQIVESKLVIPRDIRQLFLADPIWGNEWRQKPSQFDRDWGTQVDGSSTAPVPPPADQGQSVPTAPVFPSEPDSLEKLKEKYGDPIAELPVVDTPVVLLLMTGPYLFVMGKQATTLLRSDGPLILHGAGTWLTGEKAVKYEGDNPGKGIPCRFEHDQANVVLEEGNGAETDMLSLRAALQKVERGGLIDFTFGGHRCERPQEVQQGRADDCFSMTPDPDGQLLWRANTINVRNMKATNVASYFPWSKLSSSALELVWRLRVYTSEKCVAPAKPLWYLARDLPLAKDQCVRLV